MKKKKCDRCGKMFVISTPYSERDYYKTHMECDFVSKSEYKSKYENFYKYEQWEKEAIKHHPVWKERKVPWYNNG